MYANKPFCNKLSLFWGIIPVYFVIFEVTFTINYYIVFNSNYTNFFIRIISITFFDPFALMTLITHLLSMCKNPGYVPIPYQPSTNYYEINSNSSIVNSNMKTNNDLLHKPNLLLSIAEATISKVFPAPTSCANKTLLPYKTCAIAFT